MSFCASYVVCFFSRACVFFEDTLVQKQKKKSKKLAGEKCITFLISNACMVILYQLLVGSDL